MNNKNKKCIVLVVLDGFGYREDKKFNGILNSDMKNYMSFWNNYPHTLLNASGPLVGLPEGQIGSSEVGHMTIGVGRLIKEPIVQITEDIQNKKFFQNKILKKDFEFVKKTQGNIHLMGLLGPGGVHSLDKHLYGFLDFFDENIKGFKGQIFIHSFLDGRDTPQKSALKYLDDLNKKIMTLKNKDRFIMSTICGRYYAMDRDRRWDRTKKAYDMLVYSKGKQIKSYKKGMKESYKKGVTDEFVEPMVLHLKPITSGDLCVFYNFRSDRPKQLVSSFVKKDFEEFEIKKFYNLKFLTLTEYSTDFKVDVLYKPHFPKKTFGEVISNHGLKQLRIAESEKFPHVTYFFNGLKYEPFLNEDTIKVSSPKVATYDLAPEMSAQEVTDILTLQIRKQKYNFILVNFANSDMVGHTGNYEAVLKAMKKVDKCLGILKSEIDKTEGTMIITADHGNCEMMRDENNNPHTKHTYNLVPFILCDKRYKLSQNYKQNSLYNIAPTILQLFKIKKPKVMSGESLIQKWF